MKNYALILGIAAAAAGCNVDGTFTPPLADVEPDQVLLEIEYVNYAWGQVFFGYVIDGDGEVFKYDRKGAPWRPASKSSYTAAELADKFSLNRQLVTDRNDGEAREAASRIHSLASVLSQPKSQCADAGVLTYRAYKYDPVVARYTPVLLRAEGDHAQVNTSAEAQQLIAYIRSLDLIDELLGCDP